MVGKKTAHHPADAETGDLPGSSPDGHESATRPSLIRSMPFFGPLGSEAARSALARLER